MFEVVKNVLAVIGGIVVCCGIAFGALALFVELNMREWL